MRLATLSLILTLPVAAVAQQPPIFPTRDVAVTYQVAGGAQAPQTVEMAFLSARGMMRLDMAGGTPMGRGYMLVDQREGTARMVLEQQRMVMTMSGAMVPGGAGLRPSPQARFTRQGTDRVAGTACTNWRIEDRGQVGQACLTEDGVVLRARSEGGQQGSLEATAIRYGTQDPARFQVPAGYQTMDMQQMMQGLQGIPGLPAPRPSR